MVALWRQKGVSLVGNDGVKTAPADCTPCGSGRANITGSMSDMIGKLQKAPRLMTLC